MYRRAGVNRAMGPSWESTWLPRLGARPNPPQVMVAPMLTRRKMLRRGNGGPAGTGRYGRSWSEVVTAGRSTGRTGASAQAPSAASTPGSTAAGSGVSNRGRRTRAGRRRYRGSNPAVNTTDKLPRLLQAAVGHPRVAVAELPQVGRDAQGGVFEQVLVDRPFQADGHESVHPCPGGRISLETDGDLRTA